jgi:hypothetical protein
MGAHRVVRRGRSLFSMTIGSQIAVRLSALRADALYPAGRFLVLICLKRLSRTPGPIMRLKGVGKLKKSTSSGREPGIFRLVAYCPNQLRYRVPRMLSKRVIENELNYRDNET